MIYLLIALALRPMATSNDFRLVNDLLNKHRGSVMVSWCHECNSFMEIKDGKGVEGISHGICNSCFNRLMREKGLLRKIDKGA